MHLQKPFPSNKRKIEKYQSFGVICGFDSFYRKPDPCEEHSPQSHCTYRRWLLVLLILIMFECYYNVVTYHKMLQSGNKQLNYIDTSTHPPVTQKAPTVYYRYPLNNSVDVSMDYKLGYNSSYFWFMSMKHQFKNLGYEDARYPSDTPNGKSNESSMGPITVTKSEPKLEWLEQQNPDVKLGGYHAPAHCRAAQRVAIIVPYRDRRSNLAVFLGYLHPFLKKQQLEYRIFVIEQYGIEPFNKGTLYNIAFLETQRFGTWHCLIFHDVDLIPEDERISYTCQEYPTHMSVSVEAHGYVLPYTTLFGGVTSLTPQQYIAVNGYSNFYWSWGAEDDGMYVRLQSAKLPMLRCNGSIARYASLSHVRNQNGKDRYFFLNHSKLRYRREGLISTKYNLMGVTEEKLYTHILADVNPIKMKLDIKSMLREIVYLFDNSMTYAGAQVIEKGGVLHVDEKNTLMRP